MSERRFQRGDTVFVFNPDMPEQAEERVVAAVTAKTYGTPKLKLKGDEKFDWYANGSTTTMWGSRRLVSGEELPQAQVEARLRLARCALAREIEQLFEGAAREARRCLSGYRSDPNFEGMTELAGKLRTDLDALLQKAGTLTGDDETSKRGAADGG